MTAWRELKRMLQEIERPPHSIDPLIEDPVQDMADLVVMTEQYTAMLGMVRQQCLDNGLSEEAADQFVRHIISQMGEG